MKQKFGGKKSTSSERAERHDPPSATPPARQGAAGQSTSSRPVNSGLNSAVRAFSSGREKPAQPALTPANLTLFYGEALPAFKDVPNAEKQNLFVKKLHLCAFTFDFTDGSKDVREKEVKRQTLVELLDFVSTEAGKFTESVSDDVMFMISSNLFRALPTKQNEHDTLDPDEEEASFEPAWLHLQASSFLLSDDCCSAASVICLCSQNFSNFWICNKCTAIPVLLISSPARMHRIMWTSVSHELERGPKLCSKKPSLPALFVSFSWLIWGSQPSSKILRVLTPLSSVVNPEYLFDKFLLTAVYVSPGCGVTWRSLFEWWCWESNLCGVWQLTRVNTEWCTLWAHAFGDEAIVHCQNLQKLHTAEILLALQE